MLAREEKGIIRDYQTNGKGRATTNLDDWLQQKIGAHIVFLL
jgi:hypothetical protein